MPWVMRWPYLLLWVCLLNHVVGRRGIHANAQVSEPALSDPPSRTKLIVPGWKDDRLTRPRQGDRHCWPIQGRTRDRSRFAPGTESSHATTDCSADTAAERHMLEQIRGRAKRRRCRHLPAHFELVSPHVVTSLVRVKRMGMAVEAWKGERHEQPAPPAQSSVYSRFHRLLI